MIEMVGCDVFVVNPKDGLGVVGDVLVAVSGGPHSPLAARTANLFSRNEGSSLNLVHLTESGSTMGKGAFDEFLEVIDDGIDVETEVVESDDFAEDIVDLSEEYDLTLLGLPNQSRLTRYLLSSKHQEIEEKVGGPVISVRSG
ncbi:MAG: universal stress protein [Halobacteria archaeon]